MRLTIPWGLVMPVTLVVGAGCRSATPTGTSSGTQPENSASMGAPAGSMDGSEVTNATPEPRDDPAAAREARERLVRHIEVFDRPWGKGEPWDPRVLAAMRAVPRHLFMPPVSFATAYRDAPYPIGHGQTISQPTVVALMTHALKLEGGEKVLEIGTGSGYQAAVLSLLARHVYSIEIVEPLGREAETRLERLGYRNVRVRVGDGYQGWPEHAPFDRIIVTAAPPEMPRALVDQLAEGGILVAPVGDTEQELVRWTKRKGTLEKENLGAVRFVPMVPSSMVPSSAD
jgi:protein-L-isoaspartate(D-aspartate) O-methyltransferase